jgi:hypothetical protein
MAPISEFAGRRKDFRRLIWALGQALDTQFYPELRVAWLAIIEAVSLGMKNGASELPPS